MADRFQFGEFEFDPGSGDLRRRDSASVERLAPQPAQLLGLLAERRGDLVSRDEIRERLWPDTHVDFDASLHFCVRQLRTALGDSAAAPKYVQNVPRRGYRLVPEVTPLTEVAEPRTTAPSRRTLTMVALAAVSVAAIAATYYYGTRAAQESQAVRIAIMPFQAPVAEWVLEDLSRLAGDSAGIVGPTTTSAYTASDAGVRRLAADYRVDFVLNGRFLDADGRRLLIELIRVSDGVHVWVRPYDDLADSRRVGRDISHHVARVLELPRRQARSDIRR